MKSTDFIVARNWLKVIEGRGPPAVKQVYLGGRIPPDQGHILSLAT